MSFDDDSGHTHDGGNKEAGSEEKRTHCFFLLGLFGFFFVEKKTKGENKK